MTTRSDDDHDDEPPRRTGAADPYRMPETEQVLRRVIEIVEGAPGMPMSASVRVNKEELLELLDDAVARLMTMITPRTIILSLGAGNVWQVTDRLKTLLESTRPQGG